MRHFYGGEGAMTELPGRTSTPDGEQRSPGRRKTRPLMAAAAVGAALILIALGFFAVYSLYSSRITSPLVGKWTIDEFWGVSAPHQKFNGSYVEFKDDGTGTLHYSEKDSRFFRWKEVSAGKFEWFQQESARYEIQGRLLTIYATNGDVLYCERA